MISKTQIDLTLNLLDTQYNAPNVSSDLAMLYSKLAVIELCGWIEVSMDIITQDYIVRKLQSNVYKNHFEKEIMKKNHGFGFLWKENFRKMLFSAIGMYNLELIDSLLSQDIATLESELQNLNLKRNDAAHTHYNPTKIYDAPSVIIGKLNKIHPILSDIESLVVTIN